MSMRFVMPLPQGRGAGLGNEMIVWAKALIAAQALGARPLHPAWGLNPRGYRHYFGTSRLDWLAYRGLKALLPVYRFDEATYRAHGGGEFAVAVQAFASECGLQDRSAYILEVEGLWGGLDMLAPARMPLLAALLATRGTATNLADIDRKIPPDCLRVAMHIRRGDFAAPLAAADYRARFNVALPLDWYLGIARAFVAAFGERVHFLLLSDAPADELAPFAQITGNLTCTSDQSGRDVSDLLAMAFSDFLVCSISSFSLWAALFSRGRYAWFAPHLTPVSGFAGIWADEAGQQAVGSPTLLAVAEAQRLEATGESLHPRGVAVGADGNLDAGLLDDLKRVYETRRRATDLIRYGVVHATP